MHDTLTILLRGGLVPIIRLPDLGDAVPLVEALLAGGGTAVELTMTSPGALVALERLRREAPAFERGTAVIGMGSVLDEEMAAAAIDAGAQFIVAPHTDLPTVAACRRRDVPVMPGALTPTEIQAAWSAGAAVVKLFPARAFGPGYLRDILAPLPHVRLMPTGGITLENISDFMRSGAVAVGAGSQLVHPSLVAARDWKEITRRTTLYAKAIQEARKTDV